MARKRSSLEPLRGAARPARRRLTLRGEFLLALLPTVTILLVLALLEALSRQRLLFASLASSAFLIYLDPQHGTNATRTLLVSHLGAAAVGFGVDALLGAGYLAGGVAMSVTIALMILLDVVHPPAVSTSLGFAFRATPASSFLLFGLAVGITVTLVVLERLTLTLLIRLHRQYGDGEDDDEGPTGARNATDRSR